MRALPCRLYGWPSSDAHVAECCDGQATLAAVNIDPEACVHKV